MPLEEGGNIRTNVVQLSCQHQWRHEGCYGTWNHSDPGGPQYNHTKRVCVVKGCGKTECVFDRTTRKKKEGWY